MFCVGVAPQLTVCGRERAGCQNREVFPAQQDDRRDRGKNKTKQKPLDSDTRLPCCAPELAARIFSGPII